MIKMVMFDLDGTLLPMDMDVFIKCYFTLLAQKLTPCGYDDAKKLVNSIWAGVSAMVGNDGSCVNETAFWNKFTEIYGEKCLEDKPVFEEFYENEFQQAKSCCGYTEEAKKTVAALKAHGTRVALATNPLYPAVATESRIRWAGLEPEDFEFYTTYENSCFCKPNPLYYTELAEKLGVKPEECLMVGNDADEDIAAEKAGMKVFLLTDCLLNKQGKDIGKYPNGSFEDLNRFLSDCGLASMMCSSPPTRPSHTSA